MEKWKLKGFDTFEGEFYSIEGEYGSQQEAELAADECLKRFEQQQPTESSGGQSKYGIQDRVYVIYPDGTKYRYFPPAFAKCEVILKESNGSVIVKKDGGSTESVFTDLTDVKEGDRGRVVEVDGRLMFVREPHSG
ncbi:hypothetical protein JXR01_03625 [Candidatus Kaiserbacteria bacterium]|nr:MAG: hypothetical protein JXR01_03625 [Candidatus Kaiserbacteria bacterium]